MSLKITYRVTCDYCLKHISNEDYEIMPYVAAQSTALPVPKIAGHGVGKYLACDGCVAKAMGTLTAKIKEPR